MVRKQKKRKDVLCLNEIIIIDYGPRIIIAKAFITRVVHAAKYLSDKYHMVDVQRLADDVGGESLNVKP